MAIQIWRPGDKIENDRFEILKQLGKGGFGITYLAEENLDEDKKKKWQVVIKTLNADQQSEADFDQKQKNFAKEGSTLRTFNHRHIVKFYEPIQIGDLWGLVMEYIPGQDLAEYIIANGRLGEAQALKYIDQITQALDCVHQKNFFHRDVHPQNIVLRQDRDEAVLIDFGIAKEFVDLTTIYLSNTLGRQIYKPVEQYEKRGRFGAYTDIYSLSVTFYHLLTGKEPLLESIWRRDNRNTQFAIDGENLVLQKLADLEISEKTQAAIKAGMGIEPSERPQTITEFRELLGLVSTSPTTNSRSDNQEKIYLDETGNIGDDPFNFSNPVDAIQALRDKEDETIPGLLINDPFNFSNPLDAVKDLEGELKDKVREIISDLDGDPFDFNNPLDAVKDKAGDPQAKAGELLPDLDGDPFDFGSLTGKSGDFLQGGGAAAIAALFRGANKPDIADLDLSNPETDTFDRDLEAISLDSFDEDPFAGLSDILGEENDKDEDPSVDFTDLSTGEKVVSDVVQKKDRFASFVDLFVEHIKREKENPPAGLAGFYIKMSERGDFW
jgi:serine/threonine protein kinase